MEMESNYEKVFAVFQQWFIESDQKKTAEKLGLEMDEDFLYVPFFFMKSAGQTEKAERLQKKAETPFQSQTD